MSEFIVSARKYRPATFSTVVGQQSITSTLKNAIERGQLAHAYLFCGPRGVGKTTCARIFAKAINCMNPNGAEACNECESCRAFNEGRSLNIHELDAASNNSVDDIRALIEQVRIMPQIGKYSLFIIDEVHMLSQQAFNAFLKTLEEPPKHAIFILATTEKHKIIPTILSRCQVYDFNRIRVEDSVGYLKQIAQAEGVKYDEESLNLIAQKADGGMRDALSMFDKAVSFCNSELQYKQVAQTLNVLDYDTFFRMTDLLLGGDYVEALLQFDQVLAKGFSAQTFMSGLNQHMRDLLLAQGPAISLIELTGGLMERYKQQAQRCETNFLFGAISILTEADGKIKQSSNQRLLVELGLMKIAGLGKKKNNDSIIEFLEEYLLPELPSQITPVGVAVVNPSPKSNPIEKSVASSAVASSAVAQPQMSSMAAPNNVAQGAVVTEKPKVESQPKEQQTVHHSSLTGLSILSLMRDDVPQVVESQAKKEDVKESEYDEQCAEKIAANREQVLKSILHERPRFVTAFEAMTFNGHTISVEVPTKALYEEIMRSKTEILLMIVRSAGIKGMIDLEVVVNEQVKTSRPIKLEDRIQYMTQKSPLILKLKKELDMEYE